MQSRPIQPISGEKHILFGTKFRKVHQLTDENWTADDKIEQYNGIISVYEKNQDLRKEEKIVQEKSKSDHLKAQSRKAEENRERLRNVRSGQMQTIKNLFKGHRELQLIYPSKQLPEIVSDMDMRIFNRRKKLDRLLCERNRMSKLYQNNLLEVSELQDQLNYGDMQQLTNNARATELAAEIQNVKVRTKTIQALNRTCTDFIQLAMNDALYFNPILNAIQEDVTEQEDILRRIMEISRPAIENFAQLKQYFSSLNEESMRQLNARVATLLKCKENLQENSLRIRRLIRNSYEVPENRYDRETGSMLALKTDCDGIEKEIKALIAATASASVDQVFDRFVQELERNKNIKHQIKEKENELTEIAEHIYNAEAKRQAQEESFTAINIGDREQIDKHKVLIEREHEKQRDSNGHISNLSSVLLDLKTSFLHLDVLLQHVGDERTIDPKPYPCSYLALPLLKFDVTMPFRTTEPTDIEDNLRVLIDRVCSKAEILTKAYDNEADVAFNEAATVFFHNAVLEKLNNEMPEVRARSLTFESILDKNVPDRRTIKAISHRIVAENTKKDDY